ncbi:MAG: hypothetical protein R3E54_16160 [Halioglobus sp.]
MANLSLDAAPLFWVWTSVVLGLLFIVVQTYFATHVPTLGVTLQPAGANSGLRVTQVYPGLPADIADVKVGNVVLSIGNENQYLALRDDITLRDPDVAGRYATLVDFQKDVRQASSLMAAGPVQLELADGRSIQVTAQDTRPLHMLPGWFWALSAMGVIALAIGVALKAHAPGEPNTTLVLIAAFGFWLTAWSWPMYGARELAVPLPQLLGALESVNHLGFILMIGASLSLLWQYPVRLSRFSGAPLAFGIGLAIWLIITFRLYEFPLHAYYFPIFCMPLVVAIALAIAQWRLSRHKPLEKASLRWLLITMFGSTCGAFAMYVVPPLYGAEPITSPWASQLILLVFFIGLALGAGRYRLFDVERWWINTWIWFGMGVMIIVVDVALITFLQLGAAGSTVLAVVIVAWVYFPLRQYIWQIVAHAPERSPWQIMPQIASRFSRPLTDSQVTAQLGNLFESIFDAPDSVALQTAVQDPQPRLTHHGLNMVIPAPNGAGQVLLSGKHRGRRLFDLADVDYARNVVNLVGQLVELTRENEAAERTERERIMRDLHDDVGARLLSLIHGTHDPVIREEATDLLQTLRTSVIPLHNRRTTALTEAAFKWHTEIAQRVDRSGARLHWHEDVASTARLNARQYVNLTRILRELLTNALVHAKPSELWVGISTPDALRLHFEHDGSVDDPANWSWGRGQHNLATRAAEIRGELQFNLLPTDAGERLHVSLAMPL